MEIILKETIETLGQEGEIVNVKPGYARNYLIPKQKAVLVTKSSLSILEKEKQAISARLAQQQQDAEKMVGQLADKVVIISKRVGDENRLFGSVTGSDIAAGLEELGVVVDKKSIVLKDAIKALGEYKVAIKVGYQAAAEIQVQVVPEVIGE
ncbi:50S ribosomal protein L9 [Desulfogranum mediterraneum]|uniref:50S ribosomal protein L9 n=1 Tax=Desulfogranum mediterraneum TaxID=160661 RepID=UPI0003F88EDD|nr:50S ribosomal protein L9 [Desulfogranum mediterraneum]